VVHSTSSGSSSSESDEAVALYSFQSEPSTEELDILNSTEKYLEQCLFYFKDFNMSDARHRLAKHDIGSFLLRPSSDPNFFLSLSVKTTRGTTSIRIVFKNKKFFLDSDPALKRQLPMFESIPALIEFYLQLASSVHKNRVVFLESSGRKDTPIILKKPCLRQTGTLRHLCRRTIQASLVKQRSCQLHKLPGASTRILEFLQDY
ncbi:hypothetical protein CAPTEDRAFT_77182, partial [Capitella teleta]